MANNDSGQASFRQWTHKIAPRCCKIRPELNGPLQGFSRRAEPSQPAQRQSQFMVSRLQLRVRLQNPAQQRLGRRIIAAAAQGKTVHQDQSGIIRVQRPGLFTEIPGQLRVLVT